MVEYRSAHQFARQRFCSVSCASTGRCAQFWAGKSPEERREHAIALSRQRYAQQIDRMLHRVKVLADTEDERIILAWRDGKQAAKSARYREQTGQQGVHP
jgi:hypothetical protein